MLKVGAVIDAWTVTHIDAAGSRAICECVCGTMRTLAVPALLAGEATPSCGCQTLTPFQGWQRHEAAAERKRQKNFEDWEPGR